MHYAAHHLVSILIHAVIYGVIFRLMRDLSPAQLAAVLGFALVGGLFFFRRRRY
ncbi:LPXTG cell wall anchor domain-containing protein [Acidiphilium sp. C61]|uniref:LPXTG cell wall anchor domain-containing protein n=1 Tax=Acidiphilium sp. C61 TaxID=1671485 RepID=UPI00157ABE50|nr:LPXTG cell wall anchor domain-containing protein [Acidiphilium sp. C61]